MPQLSYSWHQDEWSYSAEGVLNKIGTFTNTTSKKIKISSVELYLGTLRGYVNSGTVFTGNGGSIDTYIQLSGNKSDTRTVSNVCGTGGSGDNILADTNSCQKYTFTISPVTLSVGSSADLYIMTPSLSEGSTGKVLVMQKSTGKANYEEVQDTFTITYNANGYGEAPSSQTGQLPMTIKPGPTSYDEDLYLFNYWNTKSDGTGTTYTVGSSYKNQSNVTLYAIWSYGACYLANGGIIYQSPGLQYPQGASFEKDITWSTSYTRTVYIPSNYVWQVDFNQEETGEIFQYWADKSDGSGSKYYPGKQYTISGGHKFYAISNLPSYNVKWFNGYNSTVLKSMTVKQGTTIPKSDYPPDPVRQGYKFAGWYGDTTNIRGNVNVIAMWGDSPVWIMTAEGWKKYIPKEKK